ncbi:amidase [Algihabitans albus]|uniref:amidase n=1 Tax=Algihabitans albus TaxID=2164067 RepID=UPI000E5CEAB1|nr:amidase [Algihabitans albus]
MSREPEDFGAFLAGPRRLIEGQSDGPLKGLTFVAKDLYDTAGDVTGAGNPDWAASHPPAERNASLVDDLLTAGAALVGKTHTDELSRGIFGLNAHYGAPINPAAPDRLPGGSSSGSAAAVAGALADIGLGTDTGGSVRVPAAYCGLYGLRCSHGRLPFEGVLPQAPSFDTLGWMTRDATTLRRVTEAVFGSGQARPFRLVLPEDAWAVASEATRTALQPHLDKLTGAATHVEDRTLADEGLPVWRDRQIALQQREAWANFQRWIQETNPRFAYTVAANFAAGAALDPQVHEAAVHSWPAMRGAVLELLSEDTLLCLPTVPDPAPIRGASTSEAYRDWPRIAQLTCVSGLAGTPQVTIPAGAVAGGPVGLSLIAPPGRDSDLAAAVAMLFS